MCMRLQAYSGRKFLSTRLLRIKFKQLPRFGTQSYAALKLRRTERAIVEKTFILLYEPHIKIEKTI